jgi:hypothetical protein
MLLLSMLFGLAAAPSLVSVAVGGGCPAAHVTASVAPDLAAQQQHAVLESKAKRQRPLLRVPQP